MENKDKPLSAHLQVYRWHISSLLSIAHRIVGVITKFKNYDTDLLSADDTDADNTAHDTPDVMVLLC